MYSYIKGTLEEIYEDYIVIENGGIGYQIRVPMRMTGIFLVLCMFIARGM